MNPARPLRPLFAATLLGSILLATATSEPAAVDVPPGFEVLNAFPTASFDAPVKLAILPDGRSLVAEVGGTVWMMSENGIQQPTPFLDLTSEVDAHHDLGLLGMALDPDFAENRWVYFGYTVNPETRADDHFSRVLRYQVSEADPNVADLSTRQVLLGETWPDGIPTLHRSHSICSLQFGADGSLLIGHGDGGHFEFLDSGGHDPDAFGPGRTDPAEDLGAFRAQTLNSKAGKILRVDKETGLGLPSNPFWDGDPDSDRSRVWLYGLRNPFRYSVRPGTGNNDPQTPHPGVLYIGDVGWSFYEDFHIARDGGFNLGWPCIEGPWPNQDYDAVTETEAGNVNVLCGADPSAENPAEPIVADLWFHHINDELSNPVGFRAASLTGGVFYTGPFYPAKYQNQYFLADYVYGWIALVTVDANDDVLSFETFLEDGNGPVDIEPDPLTGDLFFTSIWDGVVYRIRFGDGTSTPEEIAEQTNPLALEIAPNPVSKEATIRFALTKSGPVRVRVYDLAGRTVSTPFDGLSLSAGAHTLTWEIEGGPGIRFVRIESGSSRSAKKLIVQ